MGHEFAGEDSAAQGAYDENARDEPRHAFGDIEGRGGVRGHGYHEKVEDQGDQKKDNGNGDEVSSPKGFACHLELLKNVVVGLEIVLPVMVQRGRFQAAYGLESV